MARISLPYGCAANQIITWIGSGQGNCVLAAPRVYKVFGGSSEELVDDKTGGEADRNTGTL